jgi:hypothetical protein
VLPIRRLLLQLEPAAWSSKMASSSAVTRTLAMGCFRERGEVAALQEVAPVEVFVARAQLMDTTVVLRAEPDSDWSENALP